MSNKRMNISNCNAPQWVDFGAEELSNLSTYFDEQIELRSTNRSETLSDVQLEMEAKEMAKNDAIDNLKVPPTDDLKNAYRIPFLGTPLSKSNSPPVATPETPELEYSRPWLSKTHDNLITAMTDLSIRSECIRESLTPCNYDRNVSLTMKTSTPFITVKEKFAVEYAGKRIEDAPVSRVSEFWEIERKKMNTRTAIETRIELEATDLKESEKQKRGVDNLKLIVAAGQSSEVIVPLNAIMERSGEENMQTMITDEKYMPSCCKNIEVNFCPEKRAKSNSEITEVSSSEKIVNNYLEYNENNAGTSSHELPSSTSEVRENFTDANSKIQKFTNESRVKQKMLRSRVLTSQVRRQSLKYRRRSGQFVSMAEAILNFQRGTPKRFHSRSKRDLKAGSLQQVSCFSRKATLPMSPVLRCKSRCRRTIVTNQQKQEPLEKTGNKVTLTCKKDKPEIRDKEKEEKRPKSAFNEKPTTSFARTIPSTKEKISCEKMPKTLTKISTTKKTSTSSLKIKSATVTTSAVKKIVPEATKEQPTNANTKPTSSLSFEERNKLLLKKRQECAKPIIEQEKKARIFHARPAPNFKTVPVLRVSTENVGLNQRPPRFSPSIKTSGKSPENQENTPPFVNIQERAKKRQEFDASLKKKEEEEQTRRKQEETENVQVRKKEEKELRKTMELKAKPMPIYKHPKIAKSTKPLTNPQSPAWSRKTK